MRLYYNTIAMIDSFLDLKSKFSYGVNLLTNKRLYRTLGEPSEP